MAEFQLLIQVLKKKKKKKKKNMYLDSFKVSWRHNRSLSTGTYGLIFISFISPLLL